MSDRLGSTGFNLSTIQKGLVPYYAVYPSLQFQSKGPNSLFDVHYTYSAERHETDSPITTTGHIVSGSFNTRIGSRADFRISNTFNTSPDYSSINVLKGVNITREGFEYVFEPRIYRKDSFLNNGSVGLDIDLTPNSKLRFNGSGSVRKYGETVVQGYLSDQIRVTAGMDYLYRTSDRQEWEVGYDFRRNEYDFYSPYSTHTARAGFSRKLTPNTTFHAAAGPTFTEEVQTDSYYISYYISADVSWKLGDNFFNAGYNRRPADSTGLGQSADSNQGYLGFSRQLGRTTSLRLQASAFDQRWQSGDPYDYWGVRGSAALSQSFGKYWVASVGASYMNYMGRSDIGYNDSYRQFYGSVGFRLPNLWHFGD